MEKVTYSSGTSQGIGQKLPAAEKGADPERGRHRTPKSGQRDGQADAQQRGGGQCQWPQRTSSWRGLAPTHNRLLQSPWATPRSPDTPSLAKTTSCPWTWTCPCLCGLIPHAFRNGDTAGLPSPPGLTHLKGANFPPGKLTVMATHACEKQYPHPQSSCQRPERLTQTSHHLSS